MPQPVAAGALSGRQGEGRVRKILIVTGMPSTLEEIR
jgi:hypothetical protein